MTTEFDAILRSMIADLAKELPSNEWRSVETEMPENELPVLLLLDHPVDGTWTPVHGLQHVVGWWDGIAWCSVICDVGNYGHCQPVPITPTHWMPIPQLPAASKAEQNT